MRCDVKTKSQLAHVKPKHCLFFPPLAKESPRIPVVHRAVRLGEARLDLLLGQCSDIVHVELSTAQGISLAARVSATGQHHANSEDRERDDVHNLWRTTQYSDPAHETRELQPRHSRRVRCSAWLRFMVSLQYGNQQAP